MLSIPGPSDSPFRGRTPVRWLSEEDERLRHAVAAQPSVGTNWREVAAAVRTKNPTQCSRRWKRALQPDLKKGRWSKQEDAKLVALVSQGCSQWRELSQHMPGRSSKQCRERWTSYLDPALKRSAWSAEEDSTILNMQAHMGNRWSRIAAALPGRTENAVKLRWKSLTLVRRASFASSTASASPVHAPLRYSPVDVDMRRHHHGGINFNSGGVSNFNSSHTAEENLDARPAAAHAGRAVRPITLPPQVIEAEAAGAVDAVAAAVSHATRQVLAEAAAAVRPRLNSFDTAMSQAEAEGGFSALASPIGAGGGGGASALGFLFSPPSHPPSLQQLLLSPHSPRPAAPAAAGGGGAAAAPTRDAATRQSAAVTPPAAASAVGTNAWHAQLAAHQQQRSAAQRAELRQQRQQHLARHAALLQQQASGNVAAACGDGASGGGSKLVGRGSVDDVFSTGRLLSALQVHHGLAPWGVGDSLDIGQGHF